MTNVCSCLRAVHHMLTMKKRGIGRFLDLERPYLSRKKLI